MYVAGSLETTVKKARIHNNVSPNYMPSFCSGFYTLSSYIEVRATEKTHSH